MLETNWLKDISEITNTKWYQSKQKQQLNNQSAKKELYEKIFSSHKLDESYPKISEKYNYDNIFFIEQPVKLSVYIDGECNTETVTVEKDYETVKSDYKYCLGKVFLVQPSDKKTLENLGEKEYQQRDKFLGILTEEKFQCIESSRIYSKIKRQVEDNFLKSIQKQKAIDKINKKIALQNQAQSKEKLLIEFLESIDSERIKHNYDFTAKINTEINAIEKINGKEFVFNKSFATTKKSIKSKIFQRGIEIRGYEVDINPMPYKTYNHSCTIGEVCVMTYHLVSKEVKNPPMFICLGKVTFDTFEFYPDVREFLIDNCKFKLSEVNKIKKDCIKAWCAVPKIKKYLDKQAKKIASMQETINRLRSVEDFE